jgi:hypothetical protein
VAVEARSIRRRHQFPLGITMVCVLARPRAIHPDRCAGVRWSAANEDSAMTEAAIANHGPDLTRATCVGPVIESAADGLPREKGWTADQQAFVQQYGSGVPDSSLMRISSVGFGYPYDPMWASPVAAMDGQPNQ